MVEVKQMDREAIRQYYYLCSFAFKFAPDEQELEKLEEELKQDDLLGITQDGKLAAGLRIVPFQMYFRGKTVKMGGISSVASWPEYRRQGFVAALLTQSLQCMRQRGQVLSYLFPFKHSFYRRYGWEDALSVVDHSLSAKNLPRFSDIAGKVQRWNDNLEVLDKVYQAYARQFSGMVARDPHRWKTAVLKRCKYTYVYYDDQDQPQGYLMYNIKEDTLECREFVSLSIESRKALWNFITNHDSMVEKVTWRSPADQVDLDLLANPCQESKVRVEPMGRIVDIDQFFAQYPWPPSVGGESLIIKVTDEYAPWNDGFWEIRTGQNYQVTKLTAAPATDYVETSIQALTVLAVGFRSASYLAQVEKIRANQEQIALLERLFPPTLNYTIDFY